MEEVWKDIVGYEGQYMVSNMGRVKSVEGNYGRKERIRKLNKASEGYLKVVLSRKQKMKSYFVHRLVALAFLSNPEFLPVVHHKNDIKDDNRLENLVWFTYQQNNKDAVDKGLNVTAKGAEDSQSIPVSQFTKDGVWVKDWGGAMDAHRGTGVNRGNLSACARGEVKTAGGFVWKFT